MAGAGVYAYTHRSAPRDPRLTKAWTYAQRGENEKAAGLLAAYLGEHPRDPEALTLKFITDWWEGGIISGIKDRASDAPLSPGERALINGIDLYFDVPGARPLGDHAWNITRARC